METTVRPLYKGVIKTRKNNIVLLLGICSTVMIMERNRNTSFFFHPMRQCTDFFCFCFCFPSEGKLVRTQNQMPMFHIFFSVSWMKPQVEDGYKNSSKSGSKRNQASCSLRAIRPWRIIGHLGRDWIWTRFQGWKPTD